MYFFRITPLFVLLLLGCNLRKGTTVYRTGNVAIAASSGWATTDLHNTAAKIQLKNSSKDSYALLITEPKSDFKLGLTLDQYTRLVMDKANKPRADTEDRTVSEPVHLLVNGNPAVQFRIHATVKSTKIVYLRTMIDSPSRFNQILLWTTPSHADEDEADFQAITNSFQESNTGGS